MFMSNSAAWVWRRQGADEGEEEKRQDGVVKVKPHVCKRSLTSASALYSFLTAAHIPAVGPVTERLRGGLGERSNAGILFIIFSLHFNVFLFLKSQQSPHQVTAVIDSISDFKLDGGRFSVSTIRAVWVGWLLSSLQEQGSCLHFGSKC